MNILVFCGYEYVNITSAFKRDCYIYSFSQGSFLHLKYFLKHIQHLKNEYAVILKNILVLYYIRSNSVRLLN